VAGDIKALCQLLLGLYCLPGLIAYRRGHPKRVAIGALNLLLGWTFLGWVAALVWALA
jgi:hypothetical protein